jgi:hypothetical protein
MAPSEPFESGLYLIAKEAFRFLDVFWVKGRIEHPDDHLVQPFRSTACVIPSTCLG